MICRISGNQFEIGESEIQILKSMSGAHPLLSKELPLPTTSPSEFLREISSWGNLMNLFKSKSSFSDKSQLSRYNPELGYKICTPEEFWAQEIDNLEFGRPYDFKQPFFTQYNSLLKSVYFIGLSATNCEGSDYINGAYGAKDSYLCFGIFNTQDCMYSYMIRNSSDCMDCCDVLRSQYCYDGHTLRDCYECKYCTICTNCVECILCEDCIGCQNCIFSYGLRKQKYCIANKTVTQAEYETFVESLELHKRSKVKAAKVKFKSFIKKSGHITNTLINADNSSGQFISNVKDVEQSFYTHNAHNCGYLMLSENCSDVYRGIGESAELAYQASAYFKAYCTYNCYTDMGGSFNIYSTFVYNSCSHCFGCSGLNKKSYCILNKQYTKEEYFDLVPRIIAHMQSTGEWSNYFPAGIAPHYYENTLGNDWFEPLAPAEVKRRGYRVGYVEKEINLDGVASTLIPDSVKDLKPDFSNQTFVCDTTKRQFRFQKKELDFYTKYNIPLPDLHWKQRIENRIADVYLIPSK